MATTSIPANLAPTFFQANAADVVATADVYTVSAPTVINSPVGKFNDFDTSLLGNLKAAATGALSVLGSTGILGGVLNKALGPMGGTLAALTARVAGAAGVNLSALPTSLQSTIASVARGNASSFSNVAVNMNGISRSVSSNDIAGTTSAFNLLNTVTGNSRYATVYDTGASSTLLSTSINHLITSGMSDQIPGVLSQVKNPSVLNAALASSTSHAIGSSDLGALNTIMGTIGSRGVLAAVPNAPQQLMSSYRLPASTPRSQYASTGNQLASTMDQLQPGWDTYSRNGQSTTSLTYLSTASPDALTVLGSTEKYGTTSQLATAFSAGSYSTVQTNTHTSSSIGQAAGSGVSFNDAGSGVDFDASQLGLTFPTGNTASDLQRQFPDANW